MQECLGRIQTTINAVDDIEKAINERGVSTTGYCLMEYGDLIRQIASSSKYPWACSLLLKGFYDVPTFVADIANKDTYEVIETPPVSWFFGVIDTFNPLFLSEVKTFVAEKIDNNIIKAIVTPIEPSQLVEIIEMTE